MKLVRATTLALAASFALLACPHTPPKPEEPVAAAQEPAKVEQPDAGPAQAQPTAADEFRAQGQAELDKALEGLRNVSVFFDFDAATLTKDAQDNLTTVANILTKHPELKVRIEGNADERGSGQYNLALGQRRAEAAKKYLDNLGVKAAQITAISFGSEKPKASGHDEESWKQNRRDDVSAQGKTDAGPAK